MSEHLTSHTYWDRFYSGRADVHPVDLTSWRSAPERHIFAVKQRYQVDRGNVLEIGGGLSPWLTRLCQSYPAAQYACLDFSETGVAGLRAWIARNNIPNLVVYQGDFFESRRHHHQFDLVFSHGVVEHFTDLAAVLDAHAAYLRPGGVMITFIPNLSGVIGGFARLLNREVYDTHVPHDLESFRQGHRTAGLRLVESGYLVSTHFGILSNCLMGERGLTGLFKKTLYKALLAVSLLVWRVEALGLRLPVSKTFSPYIYAVACRPDDRSRAGDASGPAAAR